MRKWKIGLQQNSCFCTSKAENEFSWRNNRVVAWENIAVSSFHRFNRRGHLNRAADIRAQRISFLFVPIQRVQCQNVWMLLQPFSTPPGKGLCEKHGEINIPSSKSVYPPTVYLVKPAPLKTQGGLTCAAFTCRCESSVYHCLKSVVRPLTPPRTFQGKQNNWQLQQKTSSLPSTGLS